VTRQLTVAALYERRRFGKLDIVGGHRPPLQFKRPQLLEHSIADILRKRLGKLGVCLDIEFFGAELDGHLRFTFEVNRPFMLFRRESRSSQREDAQNFRPHATKFARGAEKFPPGSQKFQFDAVNFRQRAEIFLQGARIFRPAAKNFPEGAVMFRPGAQMFLIHAGIFQSDA